MLVKFCKNCMQYNGVFDTLYNNSNKEIGKCFLCDSVDEPVLDICNLCDYFSGIIEALYIDEYDKELDKEVGGDAYHSVHYIIAKQFRTSSRQNKDRFINAVFQLLEDYQPNLFKSINKKFMKDMIWGYSTTLLPIDTEARRFSSREEMEWTNFEEALINNNRFFPQETMNNGEVFKSVKKIISILETELKNEHILYRIRKGKYIHNDNMLEPPPEYTREGRLNPKYISVLYMTEEIETAIAEMRPTYEDELTVVKLKTTEMAKIIGFTLGFNIYYFIAKNIQDNFIDENLSYGKIKKLVEIINLSMSKSASGDDVYRSYLPTQYISMYIKSLGYDGLAFKSSVHSGKNVVFFTSEKVQIVENSQAKIENIRYEYSTD